MFYSYIDVSFFFSLPLSLKSIKISHLIWGCLSFTHFISSLLSSKNLKVSILPGKSKTEYIFGGTEGHR